MHTPTILYPFKGIYFFLAHPSFYPLFRARLLPIIFLSLFIYTLLFTFTYLPQVAFLAIFQPAPFLNATFLVLGEGATVTALLFEAFFVDETLVDCFDAVLTNEGLSDLVEDHHHFGIYSPFSLRQILEFIFLLPLNFIPIVGVPIFLILTGYRAGPFHHWRYFHLLDLTKKERKQYIRNRQLKYTWFGTSALFLQLVPGLSMFFLLTTACGSGLWAARMDHARRARSVS